MDIVKLAEEAGGGKHEGYEKIYVTFGPDALERFVARITAEKDAEIARLTAMVALFKDFTLTPEGGWFVAWQSCDKERMELRGAATPPAGWTKRRIANADFRRGIEETGMTPELDAYIRALPIDDQASG